MAEDNAKTYEEFRDAVNMTAGELQKWLRTEESKDVGQRSGNGESTPVGRHQRIGLALLVDELGPRSM
jgi:Protein of unknown function (DUF3140)